MLALPLLLLAADAQTTAIDAENAFRQAAQKQGQWTAFRQFSVPDAVIFTPQPERAHAALPTENPPIAVQWWPAQSFVSCDGAIAVNTGPWVRPASVGYFTTVWQRQPGGDWKWVLDHGGTLATARPIPDPPETRRAACSGKPDAAPVDSGAAPRTGAGQSPDATLLWQWEVEADGARRFRARLWNGRSYEMVVDDQVAARK